LPEQASSESVLSARLKHRFSPAFALDADLQLGVGWNVLFGPSGAGKSSLLRAVAGLLRPQQGAIGIGGATWLDTARGFFIPPEQRNVGYLAQNPSLFPHLSVAQNVAFSHRDPTDRTEITPLLELFRCEHLAQRQPASLSGGEQQRVALARALARRPQVLLLDEPFRGLDLELRDNILSDLQAYLAARPMPVLAVSHDPLEILALHAKVFRMFNGAITESGPANQILATERERMLERLA
jgi:molybdate transport system ATP-binding protein